jgi:uncharacterized protein YbjT (DUF2867 family)
MKKILVIGATGKIGKEMVPDLRTCYGHSFVVATTIDKKRDSTNQAESLSNSIYLLKTGTLNPTG